MLSLKKKTLICFFNFNYTIQPKPEIIHAKKEVIEKKATWAGGRGTSNPHSEASHIKYERDEKIIVKQKAVKVTDQLGPAPRLSDLP